MDTMGPIKTLVFDQTSAKLNATIQQRMGTSFGLFRQIHLDLKFDSFKLLFTCNKLLHNMFLNKHSMHDNQSYSGFCIGTQSN